MQEIKIGNRKIGEGHPVFIIAEIGVNHNGSLDIAKKLIDVAANAGADAVKFQKIDLSSLYQSQILENPNIAGQSFQYVIPLLKRFELSEENYQDIANYCRKKRIMFLCTPWDANSVDFLETLDVPAYKISSADMTNILLLDHVISKRKPLIVSTGMSTLDEIGTTIRFLNERNAEFALLHCNSNYPAPEKDINLNFMNALKEFGIPVGYSGHEKGIAISLAAAAMGACIIERHFTLDKTMEGTDHAASLEPKELEELISSIRKVELAKGLAKKYITRGEILNREVLGKSLVSTRDIKAGTIITKDMIAAKSPGKGLSPQYIFDIMGQKAIQDIKKDELFQEHNVEMVNRALKAYDFSTLWGLIVRFQDINHMIKYKPKLVEFHFTDKDLDLKFNKQNYEQLLFAHSPEFFGVREMVDLCSPNEQARQKYIKIVQKAIDKVEEMSKSFKGKPKMVIHMSGVRTEPTKDTKQLIRNAKDSISKLDFKNCELLPENLPPTPWCFGGQWAQDAFISPEEIYDFCKDTGLKMCLDLSHAHLYCNFYNRKLSDFIKIVQSVVTHVHVSDACGSDGEGLQIGEGEVDFDEVFRILRKKEFSWVPEIWRGHQRGGEGVLIALDRLTKYLK